MAIGATTADSPTPISVGFITYDSQLHFYNLVRVANEVSSKAHMSVVADTADVFVPSLEGFLVAPDAATLTHLLSTIPSQFTMPESSAASNPLPEPILGPAIQAGLEALKAGNRCGKLFVMHSSLPTADAPGKLKFREDRHLIGTDKEKVSSGFIWRFFKHPQQIYSPSFCNFRHCCNQPRNTTLNWVRNA